MSTAHDIIDRSYELAEEAEKQGNFADAEGFASIGRQWYLIEKKLLGVELDDDEKSEVAAFIAKHRPPETP